MGHKQALLSAGHGDVRTLIYTGRPLRVRRTFGHWEKNRQTEIMELTSKGIIPNQHELEKHPDHVPFGRSY